VMDICGPFDPDPDEGVSLELAPDEAVGDGLLGVGYLR
jgi:hypothetical protein